MSDQSLKVGVWNQYLQVTTGMVTFVKETIVQATFAWVIAFTLMILWSKLGSNLDQFFFVS